MEHLTQNRNAHPARQLSPGTTNAIPREKQIACGDIIDRWRLNLGWNVYDDVTQDLAIQSWVHALDREGVPPHLYGELYDRAIATRAAILADGGKLQNFGVEFLIAEWIGESGLRRSRFKADVAERRMLPNVSASACDDCGGTGFKPVSDERYPGVTRCFHGVN